MSAVDPAPRPAEPGRALVAVAMLVILAVAAALRLYRLGALGYVWDEDLTALAVQGILAEGLPLLPSGWLYGRALPYHYLGAAFAALFGISELSLRLPGALLSVASVWLAYCLGAALANRRVGLLAAFLASVSLWEIALARNARMYPMLTALVLCFLLAWVRGWLRGSALARWTALALLGGAVLVNDLAASLVVVYLYPWCGRWGAADADAAWAGGARGRGGVGAAAGVAGLMLALSRWLAANVGERVPTLTAEAAGPPPEGLQGLASGLAGFVRLPPPGLWIRGHGGWIAAVLLAAGLVLLAVWWARRRRQSFSPWLASGAGLLLVASVVMHQAVAALFLLLALAYGDRRPDGTVRWPRLLAWAAAAACGLGVWGLSGLATSSASPAAAVKEIAIAMMDIPQRLWWFLPERFPVLFLAAVVITVAVMLRRRVSRPVDCLGYVVVASLVGLGMGSTPTRAPRYIAHLHPVLLVLAATHLVAAWDAAARIARSWSARVGRPAVSPAWVRAAVVLAGAVLLYDVAPPHRVVNALTQTYARAVPDPVAGPWEGFPYYPDERSTALYVATNRQPGDRVVAMNWLSFAAYAGPADYLLRTSNYEVQSYRDDGFIRDIYTDAVVVPSLEALQDVVRENETGRTWVVASAIEVDRGVRVTPEILSYLDANADKVVHIGGDARGKVYLFEADRGTGAGSGAPPPGQ